LILIRAILPGLLLLAGAPVQAFTPECSPYADETIVPVLRDHFMHASKSRAAPVHLPANAQGVLFPASGTLKASDFRIFKGDKRTPLAVRVTALATATPELLPGQTIYRIGPVEGFKVGEHYQVTKGRANPVETWVAIDDALVDPSDVRLALSGPANLETQVRGAPCPSQSTLTTVTQKFGFVPSANLAPYRQLMLGTISANAGIAWAPMPKVHTYGDDYVRPGGLQDVLLYAEADHYKGKRAASMMIGAVAFLEVDDGWHAMEPLSIAIDPDKIAAMDSLAYLRQAIAGNNPAEIGKLLDQIPVRATDVADPQFRRGWLAMPDAIRDAYATWRSARRKESLRELLDDMARHPDPLVRERAVAAAARL
jgi:hypothetical protein